MPVIPGIFQSVTRKSYLPVFSIGNAVCHRQPVSIGKAEVAQKVLYDSPHGREVIDYKDFHVLVQSALHPGDVGNHLISLQLYEVSSDGRHGLSSF